ncbi:MAG: hypothetical protein OXF93_17710 [Acidobacteria bacterium]|nr:hypothetical protein [Acidobacteriota bacterium]
MDNPASLHSVNRLTAFLQSLGHRAPKSAVSDHVAWFEDAFFLDFVALMPDGSRVLVQVCETLADPRTRRREVTALHRAMAELGAHTGTIVTRDEEETMQVDAGSIDVVPAWRSLLDVGEKD